MERLEKIIQNAKKSLGKPYTKDTIAEKNQEIKNIEKDLENYLEKKVIDKERKQNILTKFNILKTKAEELLKLHENKNRTNNTMANLDLNELSIVTKLIPRFTGNSNELHKFLTSLETVSATIPTEKHVSFFNFVFKSILDLKVQNRIKQNQIPTTINELIIALKSTYKPMRTSNAILNQITSLVQRDNNLMGFATKIENLITELNEIQIAEEGEDSRNYIINTNNKIAFNTFMNGLSDPQIINTIDASQVTTFSEALKIAERASSRIEQKRVFLQNAHRNNNLVNQKSVCKKCGRKHDNQCPADGVKCHKCGKFNHFATMCLSKRTNNNNGNRNNNNNNRSYNNNANDNNRNYNTNNNNRNYNNNNQRRRNNRNHNINHMQNQGNFQDPESTQTETPEGNN